ncbi:helix-turn-helix domain-containing protein [Streptomyces sp. S1A(2023)]
MSDISQRAGVTKGALYFHFPSKEALAHTLMTDQFDITSLLTETERPGVQTAIDLTHNMAAGLRSSVRVRAGIRLVIELGFVHRPRSHALQQLDRDRPRRPGSRAGPWRREAGGQCRRRRHLRRRGLRRCADHLPGPHRAR